MEEVDSKPLLLVEVIEDPSDKAMPYKLKLNMQTVEALIPSSERYVRSHNTDSSCHHRWSLQIWKVLLGQPTCQKDERISSRWNDQGLHQRNLDLVEPSGYSSVYGRRIAAC